MKISKRNSNNLNLNIKNFMMQNKLIFAAFFVPVLLVILAFMVEGVYPFGEHQIPVIDMYHQYVPFLSELQYKLQEGGNLFYTWNGAGGSNFWNLLSYYGASPLNLLLVLFPKKFIVEGVTLILLIKIGLAGSFMAIYLRNVNNTRSIVIVGFSTLYALCSYVMAYYWCIMWIDAVALLPLCILGLNRLIEDGRAVMYTVTLALIVFINYYTAIMVCIFILFYYPILYFIKIKNGGAKHCVAVTGKAVGYSLLGVVMAAVMLLPTYLSMQNTYYISSNMPENIIFYNDALDVMNQLLPYSELTYRTGLPNLYCGMLIVILLAFYILSRTIELREKLLNIGLLTFLFLSLNINKLDFIWHGFHFPNQLPYRYTFVICFILIGMAYRALMRIDEVKVKHIWSVMAVGIGYYLLAQKLMNTHIDNTDLFFYGGIAWLLLYCFVLIAYKKGYLKKQMFMLLIVVLIVCEMATSTCTSIDKIGVTFRDEYFTNNEDICRIVEDKKDEFARMEMNDNFILNCPAMYHYKGISQFSSSLNANTTALMERIGIEGEPAKNRFNYNQTNPVTNAILNVKYLIGKNLPIEDSDFRQIRKLGNTGLYENKYPLSVGYMTGNGIRTWDYERDNPFDVLNDYVRAVTANKYNKIFTETAMPEAEDISGTNVELEAEGQGRWSCALKDNTVKSKVSLTYHADKTQKYYVFIEADKADTITINKGKKEDEIDVRNDCGSIINIGEIKEGTSFKITIEYNKDRIGDIVSHVNTMDDAVWQETYNILSRNMMEVTDFGDNYLKGTVDVDENGVFVTSVPYEKGWTLKVDGRKKEINELIGGSFISTPLDKGHHEIELKFAPPGIVAGAVITLVSIAVLMLLCRVRKYTNRRKKSVFPLEDELL